MLTLSRFLLAAALAFSATACVDDDPEAPAPTGENEDANDPDLGAQVDPDGEGLPDDGSDDCRPSLKADDDGSC